MRAPARQRGAAALAVVVLLMLGLLLVVGHAGRHLAVEQRTSASHYRSTQAFEAAEAGIAWMTAMLNASGRIDAACRPTADALATSFRDSRLTFDTARVALVARRWDDAGTPRPLRAACAWRRGAWSCDCPAAGEPSLGAADDMTVPAPAFVVELADGPRPGLVRILSTGCTRADAACTGTPTANHEAATQIEVLVGLVPAVRAEPLAALTASGDVIAGSGLAAHHDDTRAGTLAVHAGGAIAGPGPTIGGPAGTPSASLSVAGDASLALLDADRFFARHFGMSRAAWAAQPAATRVACDGPCGDAIAAAVAGGATLLAIDAPDGVETRLAGPLAIGSAARPVALVAGGALRLEGAVAMHGIVHSGSLAWSGSGGRVDGAVVVAGGVGGDADARIVFDAEVLRLLTAASGSLVTVNGSWKDFR